MKKKVISIVIIFVFTVIATISFAILFFLKSCRHIDGLNWKIENGDRFVEAIMHSSNLKTTAKYYLSDDVELCVNDLPDDGVDFYGELDGCGHTLTIKGDADEEHGCLDKPIFSTIHQGATVKRLNIVVAPNITVGVESGVNNIAVLANVNSGTISDCAFKVGKIMLNATRCSYAAALVNFNFNEISKICLEVKSVGAYNVTADTIANWKCRFGSVATVNYATVKDIFADIKFTEDASEKLPVFDSSFNNYYVGYIFSGYPADTQKIQVENVYIFCGEHDANNFPFKDNVCDFMFYEGKGQFEFKKYNMINNVFWDEIKGTWKNWEFVNQTFPKLI